MPSFLVSCVLQLLPVTEACTCWRNLHRSTALQKTDHAKGLEGLQAVLHEITGKLVPALELTPDLRQWRFNHTYTAGCVQQQSAEFWTSLSSCVVTGRAQSMCSWPCRQCAGTEYLGHDLCCCLCQAQYLESACSESNTRLTAPVCGAVRRAKQHWEFRACGRAGRRGRTWRSAAAVEPPCGVTVSVVCRKGCC